MRAANAVSLDFGITHLLVFKWAFRAARVRHSPGVNSSGVRPMENAGCEEILSAARAAFACGQFLVISYF